MSSPRFVRNTTWRMNFPPPPLASLSPGGGKSVVATTWYTASISGEMNTTPLCVSHTSTSAWRVSHPSGWPHADPSRTKGRKPYLAARSTVQRGCGQGFSAARAPRASSRKTTSQVRLILAEPSSYSSAARTACGRAPESLSPVAPATGRQAAGAAWLNSLGTCCRILPVFFVHLPRAVAASRIPQKVHAQNRDEDKHRHRGQQLLRHFGVDHRLEVVNQK